MCSYNKNSKCNIIIFYNNHENKYYASHYAFMHLSLHPLDISKPPKKAYYPTRVGIAQESLI